MTRKRMSFEEWLEPLHRMRCCNNEHYTDDDLRSAYEAGLHADVHTDNSAVIAELENKIADIKANCDLALEGRDVKIMELEQQIEKMKCCGNCKHFDFNEPNYCYKGVYREKQYVCSKWEFGN